MLHIHIGILFGSKEKWNQESHRWMGGGRKDHVEWCYPDTKRQTLHVLFPRGLLVPIIQMLLHIPKQLQKPESIKGPWGMGDWGSRVQVIWWGNGRNRMVFTKEGREINTEERGRRLKITIRMSEEVLRNHIIN